jgi:3-hydroxy-3-methylglutaryl CoA synthase
VTASTPIGIKSFGAYIPRRRMLRAAIAAAHAWALPSLKGLAKGEKAFCSWDEDAITMAVEASRDCLRGGALDSVTAVNFASTTAPYADLQNAAVVSAALRLPTAAACADSAGSVRAGMSGLAQALQSSAAGDQLIAAAERRGAKPGSVQEMLYGSAAAAVRVGRGDAVIARFLGRESVAVPFVDHFRQSGEKYDYYWEERWIRDEGIAKIVPKAVTSLLKRLEVPAARVAHFGLAGGPSGSDKLVAKTLGLTAESALPDLRAQVGDTGAAHPLLQLVAALERAQPGEVIIITSFAQGCEVLAFEMLQTVPASGGHGLAGALAQRVEETAYLKMLSFGNEIELDWGMRAETDNKTALTQLYRSADQILGFVGGKCSACNAIQFPRMPACVNCYAVNSQTPYALADEPAKVATYTADWLQYSPSPPLYMGLVQFEVGARLLMEMVDVGPAGIEVGTPLTMSFRIKERDNQRHYDRYFWKASPAVC